MGKRESWGKTLDDPGKGVWKHIHVAIKPHSSGSEALAHDPVYKAEKEVKQHKRGTSRWECLISNPIV